jgi:hypothetical protein
MSKFTRLEKKGRMKEEDRQCAKHEHERAVRKRRRREDERLRAELRQTSYRHGPQVKNPFNQWPFPTTAQFSQQNRQRGFDFWEELDRIAQEDEQGRKAEDERCHCQ